MSESFVSKLMLDIKTALKQNSKLLSPCLYKHNPLRPQLDKQACMLKIDFHYT